jgi:hypothetical protein
VDKVRREFGPDSNEDFRSRSLSARHELGPRTNLDVSLARVKEKSFGETSVGQTYDADLVTAMVTRTF